MREPELRPKSARTVVRVILVALVVAVLLYGPVTRWIACQRLAPIERLFTPGC